MEDDPDFNIDNYQIDELLDIFHIKTPITKDDIINLAQDLITKYRHLERTDYVEFFSKALNKLLSNFSSIEELLGKDNELVNSDDDDADDDVDDDIDDNTINDDTQDIDTNVLHQLDGLEKKSDIPINTKHLNGGENVFKNQYFNTHSIEERIANHVMPDRSQYTAVPHDSEHKTPQLQTRLMMPQAYTKTPYTQGYRNPTLQNAFISWINVDSQYREIKSTGTRTVSCINETQNATSNIFRQNDNSTDFLYTLNEPLTNVLELSVGSIEIPLESYYTFSDKYGNTTFQIEISYIDKDGNKTDIPPQCLKIPEGNYNGSSIVTILNRVLQSFLKGVETDKGINLDVEAIKVYFNFHQNKILFILDDSSMTPLTGTECEITEFKLHWHGIKTDQGYHNNCAPSTTTQNSNCLHTTKKINSTLGWILGFREAISEIKELKLNNYGASVDVIDTELIGQPASSVDTKTVSGCVATSTFNQHGSKYFILEVDDFNHNRNIGNMTTMTMPSSTKKFQLPKYAKNISESYKIKTVKAKNNNMTSEQFPNDIVVTTDSAPQLEYGDNTATPATEETKNAKGTYQLFKRASRKGTSAESYAVVGQHTLTKAQKYTARELSNSQNHDYAEQYFSPQASNMLLRIPLPHSSSVEQTRPIAFTNTDGMDNGRKYFGPVTIEKLRIRLLDDKGFPVDLHMADFSFSLMVKRLYQY